MGMFLISAHILYPIQKLRLCRKWDTGLDINPKHETSYTVQNQEVFLNYVEYEYCAKHQHVLVNRPASFPSRNLIASVMVSGSGQSSFDPYDLPSDDKQYLTPNNVDEMAPGQTDCFLLHAY
jgi:hypothetical protein